MKKKIKKAFTLVELLVVIAILAILATVSVVGYNSFTKKAKVSNDTVLVKQMNDVLIASQQTDDKNNTMTEALEDVFGAGYDVEKLTPTTTNYNIVWDSENDQMVLLDDNKEVVFPTEKVTTKDKMFLITKTLDDFTSTQNEFAHYLTSEFTYTGTLEITTGLDTGTNTNVNTIKYNGENTTESKNVVIRTSSYATNLEINGYVNTKDNTKGDVINHYGLVGELTVTKCAMSCYHENGSSAFTSVEYGKVIANQGGELKVVVAKSNNAVITTDGGTVTKAYKDSSVTLSDTNITFEDATQETIDSAKNESINNSLNEEMNSSTNNIEARVGTKFYSTLEEAYDAAQVKNTIVLNKDIVLDKSFVVEKEITLDLNGKKIYNTNDIWSNEWWSLISVRENGKLIITGNGSVSTKTNDCYAIDIQDGGKCTIENGTFIGNIHAVYVHTGELYVNGGTYAIQQTNYEAPEAPYGYVLNCYDESRKEGNAKISVSGGAFQNFNPADNVAEGAHTNFLEDDSYEVSMVENFIKIGSVMYSAYIVKKSN